MSIFDFNENDADSFSKMLNVYFDCTNEIILNKIRDFYISIEPFKISFATIF